MVELDESEAEFICMDVDSCWRLYLDGEVVASVDNNGETKFDWPALERAVEDGAGGHQSAWGMAVLLLAARNAGRVS